MNIRSFKPGLPAEGYQLVDANGKAVDGASIRFLRSLYQRWGRPGGTLGLLYDHWVMQGKPEPLPRDNTPRVHLAQDDRGHKIMDALDALDCGASAGASWFG